MGETLPDLMTLKDVLLKLKGIVGKTYLSRHLKDHPEYNGQPTHRRIGGKIVFYPEDLPRLIESLECRSKSSHAKEGKRYTSAEPSADKAYMKAQAQITRSMQRLTARKEKRNSGKKVFMESVPL
ncbi:hypothetical protein QQM41_11595 [Acetobacter sp. AC2005]|uniref:hypothetical protein n=1 Tax=Acetobacter sp. AC2005 TaxID=3134142 RepID=UPI0030CE516A